MIPQESGDEVVEASRSAADPARRATGHGRQPAGKPVSGGSSTSPPSSTRVKLQLVLVLGLASRLALFALLPPSTLQDLAESIELASPSTSLKSLKEAVYLARAYDLTQQGRHAVPAGSNQEQRPGKSQQVPQITSSNPWSSGHVHHSPLMVWALRPFVATPAVKLHLRPEHKYGGARSRKHEYSRQGRWEGESGGVGSFLSQLQQQTEKNAMLSGLFALAVKSASRFTPLQWLFTLLDVLGAIFLAITEARRAAWRNKYSRIRGAREVELNVQAYERQKANKDGDAEKATTNSSNSIDGEDRRAKVAALYLFNPLVLATSLAMSSTTIYNTLTCFVTMLATSISYLASRRSQLNGGAGNSVLIFLLTFLFAAALSANAVVSLYPIIIAPALVMLAARCVPSLTQHTSPRLTFRLVSLTALLTFGGMYLSLGPLSNGNVAGVLRQVYLHLFIVSDLTPNIGLWWYFFIEIFDHFRNFFLLAFNVHLASYCAPLCIKYTYDPLFAVTVLSGITAVFKSYPTLGDTALYFALLSLHPEIFPYLRYPTVTTLLYTYSLLLLPLFHHLWLHAGSGNANFFYAITLVFVLAGGSSVLDAMWAWGALAWERERPLAPPPSAVEGQADSKRVVTQV